MNRLDTRSSFGLILSMESAIFFVFVWSSKLFIEITFGFDFVGHVV